MDYENIVVVFIEEDLEVVMVFRTDVDLDSMFIHNLDVVEVAHLVFENVGIEHLENN